MPENKGCRVAIIGLGKIAQMKYLPVLTNHKYVDLCGLCDTSISLISNVVKMYRLSSSLICKDEQQVLEKKPDLVFILNHNHYQLIKFFIVNGISICVEKPVCWDSDSVSNLLHLAIKKEVCFYAAYMKQYDYNFVSYKNILEEKGTPILVNVHCYAGFNKEWGDQQYSLIKESIEEKSITKRSLTEDWLHFFSKSNIMDDRDKYLYQLLLQLGIHQINLLHKCFGDIEPLSILPIQSENVNGICCHLTNKDFPINFTLLPLFNGEWIWEECYEAVYPDSIVRYYAGSPFLKTNESHCNITGKKGEGIGSTRIRFDINDPFSNMIDFILNDFCGCRDFSYLLAKEAIRDLQLVEGIREVYGNSD